MNTTLILAGLLFLMLIWRLTWRAVNMCRKNMWLCHGKNLQASSVVRRETQNPMVVGLSPRLDDQFRSLLSRNSIELRSLWKLDEKVRHSSEKSLKGRHHEYWRGELLCRMKLSSSLSPLHVVILRRLFDYRTRKMSSNFLLWCGSQ